eukprot:97155_1
MSSPEAPVLFYDKESSDVSVGSAADDSASIPDAIPDELNLSIWKSLTAPCKGQLVNLKATASDLPMVVGWKHDLKAIKVSAILSDRIYRPSRFKYDGFNVERYEYERGKFIEIKFIAG